MLKTSILAFSAFLVSCGTFDPRLITATDPVFLPYIERFESIGDVQVGDVPVGFGDTESESHQAVCNEYGDPFNFVTWREVIVSRAHWNTLPKVKREILIFHELGHCVLGREHVETRDALGAPISIMYPSIPNSLAFSYALDPERFCIELFGPTWTLREKLDSNEHRQ